MSNDVMILNQYPPNKYNSLIPITTIQQVSDMHKVIVNQVKLDEQSDSYNQSGKRALKKEAILKLMAAANIRIIDSRPIQTQALKDAIEMSKAIGSAVDYDKRDVAHQVTIEVPDMNGGFRPVKGTKEIVFNELPDDKQTREMLKHKRAHCETKALLRALRAAMMLKAQYESKDFDKPFIVAIVVPNSDNEQVKKVMLDKFAHTNNLLFGSSDEYLSLGNEIDDNETEIISSDIEDVVIPEDELPECLKDELPETSGVHWCENEGCGQEIEQYGKNSAQDIIDNSQALFGKDYCFSCQKELAAKKKTK